ncbi:hypothetical protein ACJRO7_006238 [Eucalyptus globulus]|uniref:Protein kinase domain-containing protein n=1 Tax=Eucalyptus globulus TaxID=34317 RepID=A0ABD3ILE4_EUCGL
MINSLCSICMYHVLLFILQVLLLGTSCGAKKNHLCIASSCGEIRNISYPFRLKNDPKYCGNSKFELVCENNRTVLYLQADSRYYVKSIYYDSYHDESSFRGYITVVDDGLQEGNCSSLPRHSLRRAIFRRVFDNYLSRQVVFVKCLLPVASNSYLDTKPCIEGAYSAGTPPNFSQTKGYSYAALEAHASDIKDFCTITAVTFASDYFSCWERDQYYRVCPSYSSSYKDIHNGMARGFNLSYQNGGGLAALCILGFDYRERCRVYDSDTSMAAIVTRYAPPLLPHLLVFSTENFLVAKFMLGAPCVLMFLIYKWKRRHRAMDENIEEFLVAHNNFSPIRYSYSDIKKITKNFKHKLGEGGYGSVFKGVLRSGNEVAVKILSKPKSNGQDFISEVATIGRIHHVNVVELVGYCFNNSKQALVYDFMSNGSLDKHIFSKDGDDSLDSKKMYEISLGVARGIEYLHRGCDMQILHFGLTIFF